MPNWNRAYLDALEVPVWVPLHDQVPDNNHALDSKGETVDETPEPQKSSSVEGFKSDDALTKLALLEGQPSADFVFVVSSDVDASQYRAAMKQFEFAWRTWLEQPFSAAVAQLSDQPSEGQALEAFRGKFIACGCDLSSHDIPSLSAPSLVLSKANKKDWWSLLQRLA